MNIMAMKATRALRAVDKAKARAEQEKLRQAALRLKDHIYRATPGGGIINGPKHNVRNFLRIVFSAWIAGIIVVILFMVADRVLSGDAPPPSVHTMELPL